MDQPSLNGRRILIVEDNYFVAHQCEDALTQAGHHVVGLVATAEEAIRLALDHRPELVLMDIYLAGNGDGINAAIEIFERAGIRSVFATAYADANTKSLATRARPLGWLAKPFNDQKVVAAVESAIRNLEAHPAEAPKLP
jgi:DNA-binding NarL/FixJ family response regulator